MDPNLGNLSQPCTQGFKCEDQPVERIATGSHAHPSTEVPSRSLGEKEPINPNINLDDDDKGEGGQWSRPPKKARKHNKSSFSAPMAQNISEFSESKAEAYEKAELSTSPSSSVGSSPSGLSEGSDSVPGFHKCIEALESLEGIDDVPFEQYSKVVALLYNDLLWRYFFLKMPDARRKGWVLNI